MSKMFYDKLLAKGVPIIEIPIPPPKLTPVVGIDFIVIKTVLMSVSVVDCESQHHTEVPALTWSDVRQTGTRMLAHGGCTRSIKIIHTRLQI